MAAHTRILIVDDNRDLLDLLADSLAAGGFQADLAGNVDEALAIFDPAAHRLVLTDLQMPGRSGLELLRILRKQAKHLAVILFTGHGSIQDAVQAMKDGAFDFIAKPVEMDHLVELARRALQFQQLQRENEALRAEVGASRGSRIAPAGSSPAMKQLLGLARAVAPTDSTVLITGDSGTGKEVLADLIQCGSARSSGPYIKVNCGALNETLLESELFGHEKGAFTGATDRRIGRFELAQNGTIFLDECAEMSAGTQTRLLRVLQQRELQRVGGSQTIKLNIRVICATNKDLKAAVAASRFREDLYYRINVFPLHLPALRERKSDIPSLAFDLLRSIRQRVGRGPADISQEALDRLALYSWPGNVRELENVLERSSILCEGETLQTSDLPAEVLSGLSGLSEPAASQPQAGQLGAALAESERRQIVAALEQCAWNVTVAAKQLGISRSTMYSKLEQHGITRQGGPL